MEALVVDIRRNSLDDGPGIRTTAFFKGCVMACVWCQNPETISPEPELQHSPGSCTVCGACTTTCTHAACELIDGARQYRPDDCALDGDCVEACPAAALRIAGTAYSVDDLVAKLARDEPFYRSSGGGVTFSGGEPTLHLRYLCRVASALRARAIHLLLETCGLYNADAVERDLLPHLDMVYFDLKIANDEAHKRHTGVPNRQILANLRRLAQVAPDRVLPRIPLIPDITDADDNLRALAGVAREAGLTRIALLPYNPLWLDKRAGIGLATAYDRDRFMDAAEIERCRATVAATGLAVV